jgi:hypothetical protein
VPIDRLPESVHTLYAELLEQTLQAEAEAVAGRLPAPGSFVSKEVRGARYWYLQRSEAGRTRQYYLGRDTPALRRWMERVAEQRREQAPDAARRAEIVAMLAAGGAFRERAPVARVLRLLAEAGVFRLGGVLVGTQAFSAYGNLLGVRVVAASARTEDIDVAQERGIAVALDPAAVPADIEAVLRHADARFFAVPTLDPRQASTSFSLRGRDLRVDLLTPQRGGETAPVTLPHLKAAAQPVPFLGFLLAATQPAVLLEGSGVLVNVPDPARFLLHKLWLSAERPVAFQAKARKDLRQASQLLEVLHLDRPADLRRAWRQFETGRRTAVLAAAERLEPEARARLAALLAVG